ncbi:MAG: hypothetical protein ACTSRG_13695 [Candidatus Helarchaeota archaeon]
MKQCDNCLKAFPENELEYYLGKYLCTVCRSTCQVCKKQKKISQMVILCSTNPILEGTTVYCRNCYHKILRYLRCPKCESENITLTTNEIFMEIYCKDCNFKKTIKI